MKAIETKAEERYYHKDRMTSGLLRITLENIMLSSNGFMLPMMSMQHFIEVGEPLENGTQAKEWVTFKAINTVGITEEQWTNVLTQLGVELNVSKSNKIVTEIFEKFDDIVLMFTTSNPELFYDIPTTKWKKSV